MDHVDTVDINVAALLDREPDQDGFCDRGGEVERVSEPLRIIARSALQSP